MLEKDSTLAVQSPKSDDLHQKMAEAYVRGDADAVWVCSCSANGKMAFAVKSLTWTTRRGNISKHFASRAHISEMTKLMRFQPFGAQDDICLGLFTLDDPFALKMTIREERIQSTSLRQRVRSLEDSIPQGEQPTSSDLQQSTMQQMLAAMRQELDLA